MGILNPTAIAEHEVDGDQAVGWFRENAAGSGPFVLDHWTQGTELVMVRNENYWQDWPGTLEKIVVLFIPDPATEAMMLGAGQIDVAWNLPLSMLESLRGQAGINVQPYYAEALGVQLISMATWRPPLDNILVRRALLYSFPYEEAVRTFAPEGRRLIGGIPAMMLGYNADAFTYSHNMDLARVLLEEAGYPDGGLSFEFNWVSEEPVGRRIGVLWQEELAKLGITLNITEIPVPTYWEKTASKETMPDFVIQQWYPDFPDALAIVAPHYASWNEAPVGANNSRYYDSRIDDLLREAEQTLDPEERAALVEQLPFYVADDAAWVWVSEVPVIVALRDNVKGYRIDPARFGQFPYAEMYKE
jgi:peptide/nickel transport system substrate-binding protein